MTSLGILKVSEGTGRGSHLAIDKEKAREIGVILIVLSEEDNG